MDRGDLTVQAYGKKLMAKNPEIFKLESIAW